MEHVEEGSEHNSIRPWNFVARLDGSVESLATPTSEDDLSEGYPARFQIPHGTLHGLETDEKVKRAENFAMASLLYEIMSGKKPFEELSDSEVQNRFTRGDFPVDAATLHSSLFILSGWSEEFSQEIAKIMKAHESNKARLISTGATMLGLGLTVVVTAALAVPILGAVGFAAAGPVAGSAAAGWQASIGAVQAGSLFAWCQSAAMGGAAMGGIQAAGVAGFAGAAMGGGAAVGGIHAAGVAGIQELDEIFERVYRTPERARGL